MDIITFIVGALAGAAFVYVVFIFPRAQKQAYIDQLMIENNARAARLDKLEKKLEEREKLLRSKGFLIRDLEDE